MDRLTHVETGAAGYRGFFSADSSHSVEHLVNAIQFGHELTQGGSTWQFGKGDDPGRILQVGSRRAPSSDRVWAVGRAPSLSEPTGHPSFRLPPQHALNVDRMLSLHDEVKANTPKDKVPRGVGGWVGREHPSEPEALHVDYVSLQRGKVRRDEHPAYTLTAERGEAAMFNPAIGKLRNIAERHRKARPK